MTTASDGVSLPQDQETASKLFSNSSRMGEYDSENEDESSACSEFEKPGTFVNLTSAGKISPHRTRTLRDQEQELGELKKENFGLKLRIYHLEEALHVKNGTKDKGWQMNIELNVQMEDMKKELADRDRLLIQAKTAIDQYEDQLQALKKELEKKPQQDEEVEELKEQLKELEKRLAERERMLQDAHNCADEALERLAQEEAKNKQLQDELERLEEDMRRKIEDLERELDKREIPKPAPVVRAKAAQTDEDPLAGELAEAEAARDRLAQREKELEKEVQKLEMKVLELTQTMAKMEGDHVQRMREKQEELDRCKRQLYDLEDQMRRKEAELEEMTRKKEAESQRVRELETQLRQLRDLLHDKDNEIKNLEDRIAELERELGGDRDKDKELQDLRRKLGEAKAKRREMEAALAAKDRELKRMTEELADRDEEVRLLRAKVRDLERTIADLEEQLHRAELERNKHANILDHMQRELEDLRQQLKRYQDGVQLDQDGALAAKDATIAQLQKEIDDLRARLAEADHKYKLLNNSTAAEIASLRAAIEDLSRQIEQLKRSLKAREEELAGVLGVKVALENEAEKLRKENQRLKEEGLTLRVEIANQAKGLERAELDIEELRKLLESMGEQQAKASELAALRDQIQSLEHALKMKDLELTGLVKTLAARDQTILDLEHELRKLKREKREAEDRAGLLELEKNRLEEELALLRAKYGSHDLSMADLQDRLNRACTERDDMAAKLAVTEELLNLKEKAYRDMEAMYKQLNDELLRMQQQLNDLQGGSPVRKVKIIRETTTEASPSKSKTTLYGHLSEDILLMILQRLQELFSEITAGRADASVANSSLATKLERLRQQLQDSLHASREETDEADGRSRSTPNLSASFGSEHRRRSLSPLAEVRTLRSQLEEVLRWNEALQARLDESRRTRDAGVGMEKDRKGRGVGGAKQDEEKYAKLMREVDRLLEELGNEKEKARRERLHQEAEVSKVQETLRLNERKVLSLEEQLRAAMARRDAGTSTEEVARLEREVEEAHKRVARVTGQNEAAQTNLLDVKRQLDGLYTTVAELRAQLEFERRENKRLKEELANASLSSNDSLGASSLPNLSPRGAKNKSDSWTTPPPQRRGRKADLSALKAKNEDMLRLNSELQRKCEEQLVKGSSSSGGSSAQPSERSVHIHTTQVHQERRDEVRKETERELLAQVRKAEELLHHKEVEWIEKEEALNAQMEDAQAALRAARVNVTEMKVTVKTKDEQVLNLTKSLGKARDKAAALEEQLTILAQEKDLIIHDLKAELHRCKRELESSQSRLSSSQELFLQLQRELSNFQQLVEELRQANSSRSATKTRGSLEELIEKLLKELHSNTALASQLQATLLQGSARDSSREDVDTSFHSYVITTDGEEGAGRRNGGGRKSTKNASTYVCHTATAGKPTASSSPKTSPRLGHSNLESSSSSSFLSHSSSHEVNGSSRRRNQQSHFASLGLHGFEDFEGLETRLQRALDSPTLQGADRAFLEELLRYLRQQRRQLDENKRLLERLEQEQHNGDHHDGIPTSTHIPAFYSESGTIPASSTGHIPGPHHTSTPSYATRHTHTTRSRVQTATQTTSSPLSRSPQTVLASTGAMPRRPASSDYVRRGATPNGNYPKSARAKIELGPLYEQLLESHASLMEAKTSLLQQDRRDRSSHP